MLCLKFICYVRELHQFNVLLYVLQYLIGHHTNTADNIYMSVLQYLIGHHNNTADKHVYRYVLQYLIGHHTNTARLCTCFEEVTYVPEGKCYFVLSFVFQCITCQLQRQSWQIFCFHVKLTFSVLIG